MSRIVILVPRRAGVLERDRVWAACRRRWETQHPDWPIYEGHHDVGPFNRAAAVNRASELAAADGEWAVAVVIDADIFLAPDQVKRAVSIAAVTGRVTWAHRRWRGLNEEASKRLLADAGYADSIMPGGFEGWDGGAAARATAIERGLASVRKAGGHVAAGKGDQLCASAIADELLTVRPDMLDSVVEKTNPLSWSCCIAIPRKAWDLLGGFDERFRGWGFEDMAFQSAACALAGAERVEGDVFHLWHPRTPGLGQREQTAEAVTNARLGRRYMVALRRDHGLHDRGESSTPAEFERDIANLKRDDELLAGRAKQLGLPDWSAWWPTMQELRDGAALLRASGTAWSTSQARVIDRVDRSVTIAVHTDGRREYITQSIPSLVERVQGEIVKRVIYDDSGDPEYKAWLEQQFGPMGFYVVGPAKRLGYTGSMQALWTYLRRRCDSAFVFLAEDDFIYERDVDLDVFADTLMAQPHLRQMALLRKPYYQLELEAGGIVEQKPEAYAPAGNGNGLSWLEHREYFTANPSLFRRSLCEVPWPAGHSSERLYTERLNLDPGSRFAYWGHGEPWIEHIGAVRAGSNY